MQPASVVGRAGVLPSSPGGGLVRSTVSCCSAALFGRRTEEKEKCEEPRGPGPSPGPARQYAKSGGGLQF